MLVNVTGFLLGGVLYGLLLVMALGSRRPAVVTANGWTAGGDRPSGPVLLTALLGLLWNAGAFLAYGFPGPRGSGLIPPLLAMSFAALGFLPAVTVHAVLTRGDRPRTRAAFLTILAAYALSSSAAVLQAQAATSAAPLPSRVGLTLLTVGFTALLVPLLAITRRARESRALWIVAFSVFAVSALHLTQHTGAEEWWVEALGHHGSLLLALAILQRDYKFAFADIFLKRALALSLVVGLVLATHLTVVRVWPQVLGFREAPLTAYLLALAVLTALVQPRMRAAATWVIDAVVLRRTNHEQALQALETALADQSEEEPLIEAAGASLSEILGASWLDVTEFDGAARTRPLVMTGPHRFT